MILSPAHRAPGFEGLAGRTGRPPPTPGSWCYRQPGDVQDVIKVYLFLSVMPSLKRNSNAFHSLLEIKDAELQWEGRRL